MQKERNHKEEAIFQGEKNCSSVDGNIWNVGEIKCDCGMRILEGRKDKVGRVGKGMMENKEEDNNEEEGGGGGGRE